MVKCDLNAFFLISWHLIADQYHTYYCVTGHFFFTFYYSSKRFDVFFVNIMNYQRQTIKFVRTCNQRLMR